MANSYQSRHATPEDDFDEKLLCAENPFGSIEFQKHLNRKANQVKNKMNSILSDIAIIARKSSHQSTAPDDAKILADTAHVLSVTYSILKEIEFLDSQMTLPGEKPPINQH